MGGVKRLWEEELEQTVEDAVHGVITKKEAKNKLSRLLDDVHESGELEWIEEEMGDIDEPQKFKVINVHENVYNDLKSMAKEEKRTIAATVALSTSKARYKSRRDIEERNRQIPHNDHTVRVPEYTEEQKEQARKQHEIDKKKLEESSDFPF
tara:strand:+ start:976 stop:1431 length:456 start_codon:yes stop_codon:yes gene_type:complete